MLECGDEEEGLLKEKQEEVGLFEAIALKEVGSRRKRTSQRRFVQGHGDVAPYLMLERDDAVGGMEDDNFASIRGET